jgi:hypothetical protein
LPSWKRSYKKPEPVDSLSPAALVPAAGLLPADLEKPRGRQFCLWQVRWFLESVLKAATSLRAGAATFQLLAQTGFAGMVSGDGPTMGCGRLWLLQVGLYELQRPKERAEDWVWLIDHTIQLGTTRVLLIVGFRLSAWEAKGRGPLDHQDLQAILLEPVQTSNSQVVKKQLERAAKITGAPRAILCDQCRELNNGIEAFQAEYPRTLALNDLKHRLALLLERRLKRDSQWANFLQTAQHIRKKTQQTTLAFLAPPATKEKARFMNLGELVRWASRARAFLDNPLVPAGVVIDPERLEERAGALRQYDAILPEWQSLIDIIEAAMKWVRRDGFYRGAEADLLNLLSPLATTEATQQFVADVTHFVAEEGAALDARERVPGTSEVLESLFGKGKRLEGQQSKGGFTALVLGLAASVVKPTNEYLKAALENTGVKHITAWAQQHLGPSLQSLRRQTLGRPRTEQIQHKTLVSPSPNF